MFCPVGWRCIVCMACAGAVEPRSRARKWRRVVTAPCSVRQAEQAIFPPRRFAFLALENGQADARPRSRVPELEARMVLTTTQRYDVSPLTGAVCCVDLDQRLARE